MNKWEEELNKVVYEMDDNFNYKNINPYTKEQQILIKQHNDKVKLIKEIFNEALKEQRESIINLIRTNKDPYCFPNTEERLINDIKNI